jgi:hypothetical protein
MDWSRYKDLSPDQIKTALEAECATIWNRRPEKKLEEWANYE